MKLSRGDRALNIVIISVLGLFGLLILYPLLYVVAASFSDPTAVNAGSVYLWPVGFSIDAYDAVFRYPTVTHAFLMSLLYVSLSIIFGCFLTICGGYALSRKDLPGRGPIMLALAFTLMFSGGVIPSYLVVRSLGLLDTVWSMVIPGAMSVWQLIITRTYYQVRIPDELLECARLDGCNDLAFFRRIVLPLSAPIIAVNALLYGVGTWNGYFSALIYLSDQSLYPLQLVLRGILLQGQMDPTKMQGMDPQQLQRMQDLSNQLKYALIVLASIPPLIAYPFVQKHFQQGMMVGSLKG
ncbi:carbohydrate ABC transporter permease [Micrococcales bacterium 31B]|nr:carbohydrate ABC transporter permease [Micrococcales bacterium 31B]